MMLIWRHDEYSNAFEKVRKELTHIQSVLVENIFIPSGCCLENLLIMKYHYKIIIIFTHESEVTENILLENSHHVLKK